MQSAKKERTRALWSLMATPQNMDACCNLLHLNSGSQVHKDIVRAIVQVTGYGKQHVKPDGILEPRVLMPDGTRSTRFDVPFGDMVERFLIELKAGVLFFPVHLPDHPGWSTSFWPADRLEWRSLVERDDIRGGILLMFENIKFNGVTIDLTGAEVYQSFTNDDCDDCGSGITTDGDDIVYCSTCLVGHHQSCYGIYPVPEKEDPWYCNPCHASKQASSSRKRRRVGSPKTVAPRPRNVRLDDSDYSAIVDSTMTISDIEGTNPVLREVAGHLANRDPPRGKRHSSSNIRSSVGQSNSQTSARRVASQHANGQPAHLPPAVEHSTSRSVLANISGPSVDVPAVLEDRTRIPEPILSYQQMEGTILLTRLKDEKIFRPIRLSKIRTVDSLFKSCTQRWPEKFSAGHISRLLYIAEKDQHVEIIGGSSADFTELLRMIKRGWSIQDTQVVHVTLILLAVGEVVDF